MDNLQHLERLTQVEVQRENDNLSIASLSVKVDDTHKIVQEIQQQLSKQKGFFAGAMFVILPAWTVLTLFVSSWWDKVTGNGA